MRLFLFLLLFSVSLSGFAQARDFIRIAASSSVSPYAKSVAQNLASRGGTPLARIETVADSEAFRRLCAGNGEQHPDIAVVSRRISIDEYNSCSRSRVDLVEVQFGSDGVVLAGTVSKPPMNLTIEQLYRASARRLLIAGKLHKNPYKTWKDLDPSLPNIDIEILAPSSSSGVLAAFKQVVMDTGAETITEMSELKAITDPGEAVARARALDAAQECIGAANSGAGPAAFACIARATREDGVWIEAGDNAYAVTQTLVQVPSAVGIFGFGFVSENSDKLKGASIEGIEPTIENLASGDYPIAANQYFYIKEKHVDLIPGVQAYAEEFVSDNATGSRGYLTNQGLVPLPSSRRSAMKARIDRMRELTLSCVKDASRCR